MNIQDLSPFQQEHLRTLEQKIQYRFNDITLLITALTHSSWTNQHRSSHNERLEFLGDAVLELGVSLVLYKRFPKEREGVLTRHRSRLVNESMLASLARSIGLGECLLMDKGEEAQGGRERNALLADAMEAVLGAVYLDGGHHAAFQLVDRIYEGRWDEAAVDRKVKDYKTRLQETTQAQLRSLPVYTHLSSSGPEHARVFEVCVELSNGRSFIATGGSLKRAEQEAAKLALDSFGKQDNQ